MKALTIVTLAVALVDLLLFGVCMRAGYKAAKDRLEGKETE